MASQPQACPKVATQTITGWLDRWEGTCAVLWLSSQRTHVVHRSSLPTTAQEGDFLQRGVVQQHRRHKVEREIHALLQRRNSPRVVRLAPSEPTQEVTAQAPHRNQQRCGSPTKRKRSKRRYLLPRRRWSHKPWRRKWQRWTHRSRCRRSRKSWSYKRQKRRWRRLNTYKPLR
ncbi:MAG: DUF3006 family protein [Deltaproteobacteria bacterium]|nr:MAG: DUF3006 family protein [Deltaproteobacteria bacterium]